MAAHDLQPTRAGVWECRECHAQYGNDDYPRSGCGADEVDQAQQ